jgi:hypothetical protein
MVALAKVLPDRHSFPQMKSIRRRIDLRVPVGSGLPLDDQEVVPMSERLIDGDSFTAT